MTEIISALADISERYDAVLCDLWGCLHNGQTVYPAAVQALRDFRSKSGHVALLTNSPRPSSGVVHQLEAFNCPTDCWDQIISSGDAAQAALKSGLFGQRVYHLGPDRDLPFFEGCDVTRVPLEEAEGIVCTGLFNDDTETPEDYRLSIAQGVNKGLKLLCANPDIVVDRGDKRIYCAGAIAEAYTEAGGESHYFGKPHAPIYTLARQRLTEALGRTVEDPKILAIGDGINTDVRGAVGEGMDCIFITGGLAAEETATHHEDPDPTLLEAYLAKTELSPRFAMGFLR